MQFTSIHEAILDSMSEAVYVINRVMQIQYANPAACALTGYSIDESVGKYCHEIFCEQSELCADRCPPKRAMLDETPTLHREAETKSKDGEVRQTQISISPFFDYGQCIGAVIVIKDITELKKAEAKIEDQNRFLKSVIDALPHPFQVIDAESFRLKLANTAAYQGELPADMTCHVLSHHSSVPCADIQHPCPLERVKQTGEPVSVEHSHCGKDGKKLDMEVHGFPIFDENGKVVQMIEYCIDISERKRAATERETLIRDLQKALEDVKTLSGLLPICSSCKKIRDDRGYWNNLEQYLHEHSGAEFSHGLCPECAHKIYPEYFKK